MDGTLLYPLDWKCLYPPKCTRAVLVAKLREMAAHWQGWEDFAWYLTRTLHRHIDGPPMDWDHLHTFFWIQGYAAHVILNERFENRNAVLDLLMRHEVQFVGILRHMVVDQIRWCLIFSKQARLPDCALWGADTPENRQAVAEKREDFREGIEQAVAEFVRVLNFASAMDDVNARIAGHPLRAWFRGAHMPEATEIPVRIVEEDGRVHLAPDAQTAARFMSRRLPVPRIEVHPDGTVSRRGAGGADPSSPEASDGKGKGVRLSEEEANLQRAAAAVELATSLDASMRMGLPTHACVLGLYVKGYSIKKMKEALKCSQGTVANRLRDLEAKLGPLAGFRNLGPMIDGLQKAQNASRARRVSPKALMG